MTKIILVCHVLDDGTGDFQHLIDIYSSLINNPENQNYEFVIVLTFGFPELEVSFQEKLKAYNIPASHIYLSARNTYQKEFLSQPAFLEHLRTADQILRISSDLFLFSQNSPFHPYINPKVIHKFIGEHERHSPIIKKDIQCYSLGLGPRCYGIKLSLTKKISLEEAFAIFKKENPPFAIDLLVKTGASSVVEFSEKHKLMPAYFNNFLPFYRLLLLLCINKTITNGKGLVLYSSGSAFEDTFSQSQLFSEPFLKDSSIKEIRLIHKDSPENCKEFPINPQGQQIIYVFHGYKLNDTAYNALYEQAEIAGISGDNSLERALSSRLLPYYHSTNASNKKETLIWLGKIIEKKIALPENAKKDLVTFFENLDYWNIIIERLEVHEEEVAAIATKFASLNFTEMSKAWPLVIQHLNEHYNFYRKLPGVINNSVLITNKQTFNTTLDVLTPGVNSQFSFFGENATSTENSTNKTMPGMSKP